MRPAGHEHHKSSEQEFGMSSRRQFMASLAAPGLLGADWVRAQTLSGPPISFIVPQPAGNPTDVLARRLQVAAQRELGQPLIMENLPGAGGSLGVNKMLSAPSGTTVLMIASQTESILTPLSVKAARYTSDKLRPVLLITRGPYVLLGRSDLPARHLGELIQLARQRASRPLAYGHIGNGSMIHLLGERLARKAGFALTQVPYKGVPPVLQDLIGGQIDITFVPQSAVRDLASTGKVKVFGTTGATASDRLPEAVPLSKLDPGLSDFVHGTWGAVFVSRSLPEEEVRRLHKALTAACHEPQFQAQTAASGSDPAPPMSLQELERFMDDETRLYHAMARDIGIQPE
jgi:tripartite-type tricarboxylate transporter receptor subunit TctC